jgi:tetratricopeptide (TPR) repeat protein
MWRLVGRSAESARLSAFLARLSDGPAAMVVEGEPGIGKTALFEAALTQAAGVRVMRARCAEAESGLAYAGLADLFRSVAETEFAALPCPQRHSLEVVLGRSEVGQDAVDPQVVGRATLAVLETLGAFSPLLVAVDDVQWLDPESNRTLTFALRRLEAAPVGVLVTRRGTDGMLPLGLDRDALPDGPRERLLAGPLDPDDVELLVEERLGEPLPRTLRRRLAAVAGGNPLYALELAAAQCRADRVLGDRLALPARLEVLLADRLARLPPEAAEPLAAVAGLAAPTVTLIAAVLGEPARSGLDAAIDAGVLQVEEGRLRFSHPLLGVAASAQVAPSVRRALHASLAAALVDPVECARHLVLAADGPDAAVAAAIEEGADQARARGAPEVAAELVEAALRLTPADRTEEVRRRRVAAGYHWVTAGEVGRGRAQMAAALEEAPPGRIRTELHWRLGMLILIDDVAGAVEMLEAALAEAGSDLALQAMVARRLAGPYWWQGRLTEALQLIRRAVELAEALGDPRALLDALNLYLLGALIAGDLPPDVPARVEHLSRSFRPLPAHEDPDLTLYAVDMARGDADCAAGRLERVRQRAIEQGSEFGLVMPLALLAEVELARGRWPRALELAAESLRTARGLASPFPLTRGLLASALIHAHLGNTEVAQAAATELLDASERGGLVPLMLEGQAVLGFLALSKGDPRAAHAELGPLLERLNQVGVREPTWVRLVWSELDALLELGRLDQAAALAEELEARGHALDRPFALAAAARARGLILGARGELDDATTQLERALVMHDRLGWPFERARTLLALGVARRRSKQKRAARQALLDALAQFDGLSRSYCAEWSVAQVLSHLGSGAEIAVDQIRAALADTTPPGPDHFRAVWARWDALPPRHQAEAFAEAVPRLHDAIGALSDAERRAIHPYFHADPVGLPVFLAFRLVEQTLHAWDVHVAFEPAAALDAGAVRLLSELLPIGASRVDAAVLGTLAPSRLAVATSDPADHFVLDLDAQARLRPAVDRDVSGTLRLPTEALVRLFTGRLDAAHTPEQAVAEGRPTLDELRRLYAAF